MSKYKWPNLMKLDRVPNEKSGRYVMRGAPSEDELRKIVGRTFAASAQTLALLEAWKADPGQDDALRTAWNEEALLLSGWALAENSDGSLERSEDGLPVLVNHGNFANAQVFQDTALASLFGGDEIQDSLVTLTEARRLGRQLHGVRDDSPEYARNAARIDACVRISRQGAVGSINADRFQAAIGALHQIWKKGRMGLMEDKLLAGDYVRDIAVGVRTMTSLESWGKPPAGVSSFRAQVDAAIVLLAATNYGREKPKSRTAAALEQFHGAMGKDEPKAKAAAVERLLDSYGMDRQLGEDLKSHHDAAIFASIVNVSHLALVEPQKPMDHQLPYAITMMMQHPSLQGRSIPLSAFKPWTPTYNSQTDDDSVEESLRRLVDEMPFETHLMAGSSRFFLRRVQLISDCLKRMEDNWGLDLRTITNADTISIMVVDGNVAPGTLGAVRFEPARAHRDESGLQREMPPSLAEPPPEEPFVVEESKFSVYDNQAVQIGRDSAAVGHELGHCVVMRTVPLDRLIPKLLAPSGILEMSERSLKNRLGETPLSQNYKAYLEDPNEIVARSQADANTIAVVSQAKGETFEEKLYDALNTGGFDLGIGEHFSLVLSEDPEKVRAALSKLNDCVASEVQIRKDVDFRASAEANKPVQLSSESPSDHMSM